jgi:Fe-S-cluster-containing dehydrogenase component
MAMTRREALRKLTTGTVSVVATGAVTGVTLSAAAHSEEKIAAPTEALGLLYDATRCVGCQSCVAACAQANNLPPDTRLNGLHQIAYDLNSTTKNIIKLYRPADGKSYSYVKQQCMHCVDPACVAGCMFKGLKKDVKTGVVTWDAKLCVGCRYCEIACPYHIPKFQWEGFNPRIVKCELCKERLANGQQPACSAVCPVHAVVFGKRSELLAEAKRRIKENPGKYYQDRVYGEREAGGTQCLYLSHVPFANLGLPDLPDESVPQKYLKWQKRVYSYLAVPAVLYASVVGVIRNNWKDFQGHIREEEEETGLRPQL